MNGDINVSVDRMVPTADGDVETVVTIRLGYVAETPADALWLASITSFDAFGLAREETVTAT